MGEVVLTECGSVGFCSIGVAVLVYPEGIWYGQVQPEDVPEIVEEHLENDKRCRAARLDRSARMPRKIAPIGRQNSRFAKRTSLPVHICIR